MAALSMAVSAEAVHTGLPCDNPTEFLEIKVSDVEASDGESIDARLCR